MKKWLPNRSLSHNIAEMGLYIALLIVLTRFFSLTMWNMRVGFGFVALLVAGIRLGPVGAMLVAVVADLIGATLFPSGPLHLGITLNAALSGLLYGLFFFKEIRLKNILLFLFFDQIIISLIIQTYWLAGLYGNPYLATLISRIPQVILMSVVKGVVLLSLSKSAFYARLRTGFVL